MTPQSRRTEGSEFHVPEVSEALLKALEAAFPDRCPGKDDSLEDIRFASGQVSVVRMLRSHFNRQNDIDQDH